MYVPKSVVLNTIWSDKLILLQCVLRYVVILSRLRVHIFTNHGSQNPGRPDVHEKLRVFSWKLLQPNKWINILKMSQISLLNGILFVDFPHMIKITWISKQFNNYFWNRVAPWLDEDSLTTSILEKVQFDVIMFNFGLKVWIKTRGI